jgi:hypothetical protein
LVSPEEEAELKRRGWELEEPPEELKTVLVSGDPDRTRMVYVDNDMFSIMDGPDWEKGESLFPRHPSKPGKKP